MRDTRGEPCAGRRRGRAFLSFAHGAAAGNGCRCYDRDKLLQVGDLSLFITGFFTDSPTRSFVDIDYYVQLGEHAYASPARQGDGTFGDVFDELSGNSPAFFEVLGEASERTTLTSNADLLRLCKRWQRTKSCRSGDFLASRGIIANAPVSSRFIQ